MAGWHPCTSWDDATDLLAHSVIGYAVERLKTPKDPTWGARPAEQLAELLDGVIRPRASAATGASSLFRDVLMHACRPMDSPLHLAYVATAPTPAANLFDLVVSVSSIFGGLWEGGAGAIAAENQTWSGWPGSPGSPTGPGGCFVSGGSAANLSALVTDRHHARVRHGDPLDEAVALRAPPERRTPPCTPRHGSWTSTSCWSRPTLGVG